MTDMSLSLHVDGGMSYLHIRDTSFDMSYLHVIYFVSSAQAKRELGLLRWFLGWQVDVGSRFP